MYVTELVLQPMFLQIQITATNTAVIAWPAPATGWVLQQSDTLAPANWINSSFAPRALGAQNQVIIPQPAGNKFFRLVHP